jgi:prolyl oligopeptidase
MFTRPRARTVATCWLGCVLLAAVGAASVAQPPDPLAPVGIAAQPSAPPARPVSETLYGTTIEDPYRYFEQMGPETTAWMKAQGDYTREVFDAIAPRAALRQRIADFVSRFGLVEGYVNYGGRAFYQERAPGADGFDLRVRDAAGTRTLIDIGAWSARNGGKPHAIDFFLAAPDGSKVAAGISAGGSEASSLFVFDAATGTQIAGPIDRADFGATAWSEDARTLYFIRLKALAPGNADVERYLDATLNAWDLVSVPVPILGSTLGRGPAFAPVETPALDITPGAPLALAIAINGVQNEVAAWTAPVQRVADPNVTWQPFVTRDDGVTSIVMRGNDIYLLSHRDAPMFQVLTVRAGAPLAAAQVLVAARPDRLIESIHAAADALYVLTVEGGYSRLLRIANGSTEVTDVALPFPGYATGVFSDPRANGITLTHASWTDPPATLRYDPDGGVFKPIELAARPQFDSAAMRVDDLSATAGDGVRVPLTLVRPRGADVPRITLLEAYGAYGLSLLPEFSPRIAALLREGGAYAVCHVRGGGELGEAWRLAGKDANKPNTWRDLIACAQDLIARGVTTRESLFIFGGSAGGIAVGMALTERPELFAGVIDAVPAANATRSEFSPNGPPNVPEFGTVATEDGFRNLLAMDSYQHVRSGVAYPAVMITTGLNDPRVSAWEPAKFAAQLQASGTPNPVLLRIETDGGHGIGATREQGDALYADIYAFMFWRAGAPGWRPERHH